MVEDSDVDVDKILSAISEFKTVAKCSKDYTTSIEREKGSDVNRDLEMDRISVMAFRPTLEAKLRELLHKISSHEIKLCSDAVKEFSKLLKGETGGNLLHLYFHSSPEFKELKDAWELRHSGKRGLSCIFPLIKTILSHPEGRSRSTEIKKAIDEFCWSLIREKLDDIYSVLNSNEGKQQNAALSLLALMVRRDPYMASAIAKTFDFKHFAKLGEYKKQGARKAMKKHSTRTRRRFVAFAISFLEVGKPKFLKSVLRQKEMYSIVLQGLGTDNEDTVASVLSTLKDKILVLDDSIVTPPLRKAFFGHKTLEQLASISAREDDGIVNELAHDVLVKICTDSSNGLMPDANRNLTGDPGRLLNFMKRLRTLESCYHVDLLLAIVGSRPSLASAFLDEFPYNVEDLASPSWLSSISLAANLVSSVRATCSFDFLNPDQRSTPPSAVSDVQTIMKCICPRPFSRSLITKGMLHSDSLVKGGTLTFLSETLRLWDSFVTAWKLSLSRSCSSEQIQASLEQDFMGEARSFFPDPQVLLNALKTLEGEAVLDSGQVDSKKPLKRSEQDGDIVMNVVGSDKDVFSADSQMTDQADAEMVDQVDVGKEAVLINLLDDLRIYMHSGLNGVEGSFDGFMKSLSSSLDLPAELQRALLSVLNEYISWTPKLQIERVPTRIPPLMFKHLRVFLNLILFSSDDEVKDLAKNLALAAMSSTGAFDKNPSERHLFLPSYQDGVEGTSSVVISFLCDAVSTVGNNLFKQWDDVRRIFSHLEGVSIDFSPLILCILQKCESLISKSKIHSPEEKTAISLYVCNTSKSLLQTQVDPKPLSCLIQSVLSKVVGESKDSCEGRPLRELLLFSESLSEKKPESLKSGLADTSSEDTVDKIKERVISISPDEIPGVAKEFSSAESLSQSGELTSILKHLIISSPNSVRVGSCCFEDPDYVKQLSIVKTLRVLLSKCGKDSGIDLKEVHFLLWCSYGATLSEMDLEIYKLMQHIESIDEEHMLDVYETGYLWGKAALKMREGLRFSEDGGEADLEEDLRQRLFKDNLCVDPEICALTVLYFPDQHTADISDNSNIYDDPISEKCYDPAFILRFSIHSLSMGYIEPVEFASLGLLAVAFVSMSSSDLGMRKLGYETLGLFLDAIKSCRKDIHVKRLWLLLIYVQHGVREPWQRIPTVSAVFAAEASVILLDSSRKHFVPIIELLKSSSTPKLMGIPLFHDVFWSSSVEQRLWVLRLMYSGLKSEDDAQIYITNSVLEILMSFSSTPFADAETKRLILQVVRKSVKFHKMVQHLVKNCGLLPWCSSFISTFTTKPPIGDEESRFVVVLEIITEALASINVTELLQRFALEGLMEISSRLVLIQANGTSVDLISRILFATEKISQKREMQSS